MVSCALTFFEVEVFKCIEKGEPTSKPILACLKWMLHCVRMGGRGGKRIALSARIGGLPLCCDKCREKNVQEKGGEDLDMTVDEWGERKSERKSVETNDNPSVGDERRRRNRGGLRDALFVLFKEGGDATELAGGLLTRIVVEGNATVAKWAAGDGKEWIDEVRIWFAKVCWMGGKQLFVSCLDKRSYTWLARCRQLSWMEVAGTAAQPALAATDPSTNSRGNIVGAARRFVKHEQCSRCWAQFGGG
jgi:hypothetical protein